MLTTCSRCTISTLQSITGCSNTCTDSTSTTVVSSVQKIYDITGCTKECDGVTAVSVPFCTINTSTSKVEEPILKFTFTTMNNLEIAILTMGARIISLKVPDTLKSSDEILLTFDSIENYQKYEDFNVGGLVGKIKRTPLKLDEINFESYLSSNCELVLSAVLREEPEVCPCDLFLQIKFTICKNNTITIEYLARVARPVLFNIGYRLYMNFTGFDCEKDEIKQQVLFINSDKFYDQDSKLAVTVDETPFDLRIPVNFESIMKDDDDFEQIYLLKQDPNEKITFVSRIIEPNSGRVLEIYTNQPSVIFNSSMLLPPCKPIEEPEEHETEELEGDEEPECGECEDLTSPKIITHSNFPHCFLRHKMNVKSEEDCVTTRGKGKKTKTTCSTQSASNVDLESEESVPPCDYEHCGFYFQPCGIPPKGSILKPGQQYHQTVLYKFGYYCPMEKPEDDSCCSDSTGSTGT